MSVSKSSSDSLYPSEPSVPVPLLGDAVSQLREREKVYRPGVDVFLEEGDAIPAPSFFLRLEKSVSSEKRRGSRRAATMLLVTLAAAKLSSLVVPTKSLGSNYAREQKYKTGSTSP